VTKRRIALWLLVIVGLLAYQNSFVAPFVFDDSNVVTDNWTIRRLWPVWSALSPPHAGGSTVEGRPVLNYSFALNYAFSGVRPWGYHAMNLAIHILAGLTLFGIVRRTLSRPVLQKQFGGRATWLALAIAMIWTLHPLQTEAVTYVAQRAESLMGLFYLLTLYGFIRGVESPRPGWWYGFSVIACLLGMGTKEVMVSAPLIVLVYDALFVAGSVPQAWRKRWRLYVGLAATWVLLDRLVAATSTRGGTAGFGGDMSWWEYALTQCRAIVLYLRLSVWPYPLVFDYGTATIKHLGQVLPDALAVVALAVGTVIALWRRRPIGFLGLWFFAILAPSSSVVPVTTQTMAEHRMYLSLAAVVALVVLAPYAWLGRGWLLVFLALAMGLGFLTFLRNEDYRSNLTLWSDAARKLPTNVRAYANVGYALFKAGRVPDAIEEYDQALRIDPDSVDAHTDLAIALVESGMVEDGVRHFQMAMRIEPHWATTHYNLGTALARAGRSEEAVTQFQAALHLTPNYPAVHYNLAEVLLARGRTSEAIDHYEQTLRLTPDNVEALYHLGNALARSGQLDDAISQYLKALQLKPEDAEIHLNLGAAYAKLGRSEKAIQQYQEALRIQPGYAAAHNSWANALMRAGNPAEAIGHYQQALQSVPNSVEIHYNLGVALERVGRVPEAIQQYQLALKLQPGLAAASNALTRLHAGLVTN
jgi:tetratricopeptide (TPR) repeat protein